MGLKQGSMPLGIGTVRSLTGMSPEGSRDPRALSALSASWLACGSARANNLHREKSVNAMRRLERLDVS
eukprot:2123511-Amphidinium_carterae.2